MKTLKYAGIALLSLVLFGGTLAGTYALWSDAESFTGNINTAHVQFTVGTPTNVSDTITSDNKTVNYQITQANAVTLEANGKIAIPIRVQSLAQGNQGLSYEAMLPTFTVGTPFALGDTKFFKVNTPGECTVADAPASPPAPPYKSTPITSDYSDTTALTEEYWCLTSVYTAGAYTNTGTVSGSIAGDSYTDSDTWSVDVKADTTAANNPDRPITFTYKTFRPGETP